MAASHHRLVMVGANHKSASLTLRDALFVDDAAAPAFLEGLKRAGLAEALVLSTCDRVEVWAMAGDADHAAQLVCDAWAARAGLEPAAVAANLTTLTGEDAARHGFAVTAALDSLVIGEPHVAGQVKAAHRLARDAGTLGSGLDAYVQAAFSVAKRVRTETAIGEGPVSIAAAAVQVARDLHGDPARLKALLVGTGEMGELVAESLLAAGLKDLSVTAPRSSRAESLAKSLGCHVLAFEDMKEALASADVVLTCVGGRNVVVGADAVANAIRKRRRRPILLVDAGIPGDVETAVNRVDGAFLYDLADLEKVALAGRATRETAARAARALVEEELVAFLRGRAERAAVPAIVALRARFDEAREAVLAEQGHDAAEATRLLVNRLLHAPSEVLKDSAADSPDWRAMEKTLRTLFRLED
ncbi:glutamyl-tRNA reductase [Paramagnetospirillum marisnigri]|uniref:Glutamyl-tRNA reductase n=1 Tax=Paramagnetospirillum marisnigri TaxID=1285242 RepID=A0A178MIU8_9PROT|nr:glutamyl-tRNA reductase [Paramagnetospirillum marisnigri]OAN48087.1 glutamyl-tRNA reductase [Paramagnetospirillum marisnigri]